MQTSAKRHLPLLLVFPALLVGYCLGTLEGDGGGAAQEGDGAPGITGASLAQAPGSQSASQAPTLASARPVEASLQRPQEEGPAASERAPVEVEEAPTELESVATPALDRGNLRARLEEYLASDIIARRFAEDPEGLARFLIYEYVNSGDTWTAWEILSEHPLDPGTFANVGTHLKGAGHLAEAREALLHALRTDPMNTGWAQQLADLDPAGALAILDEQLASNPALERSPLPLQAVRLLLANEQTDEAQRRLSDLLASGRADNEIWGLVAQMGDEFAQHHLRKALRDDPDSEGALLRLARYLSENDGDPEEVVALSQQLLERNPGSRQALDMLAQIDPELSVQALRRSLDRDPSNEDLWTRLGDRLSQSGDIPGAVDAWMRAYESDHSDYSVLWNLREHAPDQFWPAIEQAAAERDYDELWGDVADAYWEEGRFAEAQTAWERARELDPDDGEWIGKLRALDEENDPLGNIEWGWGNSNTYSSYSSIDVGGFSNSAWLGGEVPVLMDSVQTLNGLGYSGEPMVIDW